MAKKLYLSKDKLDAGYNTTNIAQKFSELDHKIVFEYAKVAQVDNSYWIYGVARIISGEYAVIKPGNKGGDLMTIEEDWANFAPAETDQRLLALEFHADPYSHYDYKAKERKQVEPEGGEKAIATLLKSYIDTEPASYTLTLQNYPSAIADAIAQDPDSPIAAAMITSLFSVGEGKNPNEITLPTFTAPSGYSGGSGGGGRKYKTPAERIAEREEAISNKVVEVLSNAFEGEGTDAIKAALPNLGTMCPDVVELLLPEQATLQMGAGKTCPERLITLTVALIRWYSTLS